MPKKRALLVGINSYSQAQFNLRGCLNDVGSMADTLKGTYGFASDDMVTLTDAEANRADILKSLANLVDGVSPGDVLVFSYSGHGTQLQAGGPADPNRVEAIVPYEATFDTLVSNSDINNIIRQALSKMTDGQGRAVPAGAASVTTIFDCCHSGYMFRECVISEGRLVEAYVAEQQVLNRYIDLGSLSGAEFKLKDITINPFNVFSACGDLETAADLLAAPLKDPTLTEAHGAFTFALLKAIRKDPAITAAGLEAQVLPAIQQVSPHIQTPQYAASRNDVPIFTTY